MLQVVVHCKCPIRFQNCHNCKIFNIKILQSLLW